MYKIIGADQKEYGPVSDDQLRHWIRESRVNGQTRVRVEGEQEWRPLSAVAEFADALGVAAVSPPSFPGTEGSQVATEDILARDYDLDIGGCFGGGLDLLKNNFGVLFSGVLIYFGVELGMALLGAIPFIGPLFSLANVVIVGPLLGGVYYLVLKLIRRQPSGAGDVFAGFRTAFAQLFLGNLIPGLLAALCMIPVLIAALFRFIPILVHHQKPTGADLVVVIVVGAVCMIPMIFLQINWMFTLPLIIDRRMSFWPAMQTSWKMVMRHWWRVFGLVFLVGLLNLGGLLLCCVGLLFTIPWGLGALMYGYETIFGSRPAQTA